MLRTGIITPYLTLRYVVRSGFINTYPFAWLIRRRNLQILRGQQQLARADLGVRQARARERYLQVGFVH